MLKALFFPSLFRGKHPTHVLSLQSVIFHFAKKNIIVYLFDVISPFCKDLGILSIKTLRIFFVFHNFRHKLCHVLKIDMETKLG